MLEVPGFNLPMTDIPGRGKRAQKHAYERWNTGVTKAAQRRAGERRRANLAPLAPSRYVLPDPWKAHRNRSNPSRKPSDVVTSTGHATFSEHSLTTCLTCNPRRPYATRDVPDLS